MELLIEFKRYPEEQAIIGRLLMAYGEMEFGVAKLLGHAFDGDDNIAARLFFRVHGEGPRIDVADAILRRFFTHLKLAGQWSNTVGALRYCKAVRNQYAHCNWLADSSRPLTFINMDTDVSSPDGELMLLLYPTSLAVLKEQQKFFEYATDWLYFLDCQCRRRSGIEAPDPPEPKSIPQPPKHNRRKTPPPTQAPKTPQKGPLEG